LEHLPGRSVSKRPEYNNRNQKHGFMDSTDEKRRYQTLTGYPALRDRIEQVQQYTSRLLPFIPRGLAVYQSHGILHSLNIIGSINRLITAPGMQITHTEAFLLYLAAWLHDLGYLHPLSVYDRGMHAELSIEMISRDNTILNLVEKQELPILETIIRYHDTRTNLDIIREEIPSIRTPLLAAIFRIADAVDIGTDRCPPEVFMLIGDGLNEHSRRHWQAHHNIINVTITYPVITIEVRDPENPFFRRRIIAHLEEDCMSAGRVLKRYGLAPVILQCRKNKLDSSQ
jgi:hypothetical protein